MSEDKRKSLKMGGKYSRILQLGEKRALKVIKKYLALLEKDKAKEGENDAKKFMQSHFLSRNKRHNKYFYQSLVWFLADIIHPLMAAYEDMKESAEIYSGGRAETQTKSEVFKWVYEIIKSYERKENKGA